MQVRTRCEPCPSSGSAVEDALRNVEGACIPNATFIRVDVGDLVLAWSGEGSGAHAVHRSRDKPKTGGAG